MVRHAGVDEHQRGSLASRLEVEFRAILKRRIPLTTFDVLHLVSFTRETRERYHCDQNTRSLNARASNNGAPPSSCFSFDRCAADLADKLT